PAARATSVAAAAAPVGHATAVGTRCSTASTVAAAAIPAATSAAPPGRGVPTTVRATVAAPAAAAAAGRAPRAAAAPPPAPPAATSAAPPGRGVPTTVRATVAAPAAAAAAGAARRAAADLPPARTPAPASAAAPVARSAMATGDTAGATSGGREPPGAGGSGHRRGRPIPAGAGPQRPPRRPGVPCATPLTRAGDLPGDLAPARSRPTTARPGRCEVADV